jgi:hypothetical protein
MLTAGVVRTVVEDRARTVLFVEQLLGGAESLFRDGRRRDRDDHEAVQAELYERIDRLNMEVEWLKKRSR